MAEWFEALEISRDGVGIGKYRMTRRTDDPVSGPFGLCEHEHDTSEEARDCPDVQPVIEANFPKRKATPAEENERLHALLRRHHDHHLQKGAIGLPDGEGGWIEIDNGAEYADSALYSETQAALETSDKRDSSTSDASGSGQ